jgi:hypothetical protein
MQSVWKTACMLQGGMCMCEALACIASCRVDSWVCEQLCL